MSTETALIPVERADAAVDQVAQRVTEAEAQADAMRVTSEAEANAAGQVLRDIARYRKEAEKERTELVGPLNATVKKINKRFKDAVAPFDAADRKLREKVGAFQAEQERKRAEEEARLERERQERERLAGLAREAQEAEARAKREQAEREEREAAELRQKAKDDEDRKAAEALAAEAAAKAAEAQTAEEVIASLPEPTLPKAMVPAAAKPEGISTRKVWKVKSIVLPLLPDAYKIADEKAINAAMRDGVREDGKPPEISGVVFEQIDEMAVKV